MFREMRRKKQEISAEECVRILNTEKRGALSVIGDDGYPYAVPLDFYYDAESNKIYFHCARAGHKLDAIKNNNKVCFTVWNAGVRKKDDWADYVTSVVVFGRAVIVSEDVVIYEKLKAIGMKYYPSAREVENEINSALSRVCIVEINIEHMTGKLVHER